MILWLLKRYIAQQVIQGYDHPQRITALYKLIGDAAKREFYEDNDATRREYLREWFEKSL